MRRLQPPEDLAICALIAGAIWLALMVMYPGCAHVKTVAVACEGAVTTELLDSVGDALAEQNYEAAIIRATVGVAPCLVVAAVRQLLEYNMAYAADESPVIARGRDWLAKHGEPPR